MRWIDAPVSGGVSGAQHGRLAIMCGGEKADVDRSRPILGQLSQRVTHMGPLGCGQITKLCNQVIVSCNLAVISEAINLARTAGIRTELIPEALKGGFCGLTCRYRFTAPAWRASITMNLWGRYAPCSRTSGTPCRLHSPLDAHLPMTGSAEEIYQLVSDKGYLHKDLEKPHETVR